MVMSNNGAYRVVFTPHPDPIPLNEVFSIDVQITPAADQKAGQDHLSLEVDAAMPAHQHGMNTRPRVRSNGGGRFTVEGMLFHMPGHWEIYFDIVAGAMSERAQFNVELE